MAEVRTSVRHLRAGDVLIGSGQRVLATPYVTTRTSGSKRLVPVENTRGHREVKLWNASTTMTVRRDA